jgi:hypothetical protein
MDNVKLSSSFGYLLHEILFCCRMLVAHAYNPSYLGGRNQEDRSSEPVQANSWKDPISNTST